MARAKKTAKKTAKNAAKNAAGSKDGASVQSTRRPARRPPVPPDWSPRITDPEQIDDLLTRLPDEPGVYIMRDREGHVIYVGKARRLRSRVRQYFSGHDTRAFVPLLTKLLGDIETVVLANNKEALLLENNLIKEHRPRFNVKLRDDSNYLVLRLDPKQEWPRLELVRSMGTDGAHYFGPYHSASSARQTLRVVNRHFRLRTCTDYALTHRKRPCLQFQIDRCPAPCVYDVDEQEYDDQVSDVALFLGGRHKELVKSLRTRMERAAGGLEFETAARLRDQLRAVETTLQSQQVVGSGNSDQDAVGMYREGGQVEFAVLHVRKGKLLGSQSYSATGMELPDEEVLANFVSEYYQRAPFLPDEILLPSPIAEDDEAPLLSWMRERKGKKVAIAVPERGDRKALTRLAGKNAGNNFVTRRKPSGGQRGRAVPTPGAPRSVSAAADDRVLRRQPHPGQRHRRLDGGVRRRRAGQVTLPVVQDQGDRAARRRHDAGAGRVSERRLHQHVRGARPEDPARAAGLGRLGAAGPAGDRRW